MKKVYNDQTGNYKIDLFINGMYVASTDWSKTCKQAKQNWLNKNTLKEGQKLSAYFARQ